MTFKTQAEIYRALLDGKKIKHYTWDNGLYLIMKNGLLFNSHDRHTGYDFGYPHDWTFYEEPKPKKQVWQWRVRGVSGDWFTSTPLLNEQQAAAYFKETKYEKHAGPFEVPSND